jgi:glycosyltransferase involved in cell wall biosynthesis
VLVGYLGHVDVHLARLLFPRTPVLLDHLVSAADTARDRRAGPAAQRLLAALDAAALRAADVVLVDTEEHLQLLPPRARRTGLVVAVGAPAAWFAARRHRPDPTPDRPLRVVFFGLYTPLQGAPVVGAALAALAGDPVEATMVGRGQDLAATRAAAGPAARVTWRDWVGPEELPALVAEHDVCLGIFGTGPKARRVVPNKVFQGAAAGCAVVTSATEPQLRALGEAAVVVPAGDPVALAAVLRRLANDRTELTRVRERCAALADAEFRAERVLAPLVEALRRESPAAAREHAR